MAKSYDGTNPYGIDPALYADMQKRASQEATYYNSPGVPLTNQVVQAKAMDRMIKEYGTKSGVTGGGTQSGNEGFSGIADQEVYGALKSKLSGMLAGTDADTLRAKQLKEQSISGYDSLLRDYSKQSAFTDAASMMQQNLNSAMEANKPAIQRAVEGSGTSAGSMQALLSQQLADKAALSAGSMGAEQAKAYGQISANLMGSRGQLTTGRDSGVSDIAMIADLLKVNKTSGYGNFDPLREQMWAAQTANAGAGAAKSWSTYGPDAKNQWMTKPGSLEDKFRIGTANPLLPENNMLYGSNGTY